MSIRARQAEGPFALDHSAADRLERRIGDAVALARRRGSRAVASVTQAVDPAVDLSAAVLSSRRPSDRYVCIEQPGRDGHAVCGLGATVTLHATGSDRGSTRGPRRRAAISTRAPSPTTRRPTPSDRPRPVRCTSAASRSPTPAGRRPNGPGSPPPSSCCPTCRLPGRGARPA